MVNKLISVNGLEVMTSTFLSGIGEYSRVDIKDLIKLVNPDNSGNINTDKFDVLIVLAVGADKTNTAHHVKVKRRLTEESMFLSVLTGGMCGESDCEDAIMLDDDSTIAYMESMISDVKHPLDD